MSDEVPRRNDQRRLVSAERAIFDAISEVENLPADVRLTDAVVLLQAARAAVADYVDGENTSMRRYLTLSPLGIESSGSVAADARFHAYEEIAKIPAVAAFYLEYRWTLEACVLKALSSVASMAASHDTSDDERMAALARAMKKMLPADLLAEVIACCDPVGAFVEFLRRPA